MSSRSMASWTSSTLASPPGNALARSSTTARAIFAPSAGSAAPTSRAASSTARSMRAASKGRMVPSRARTFVGGRARCRAPGTARPGEAAIRALREVVDEPHDACGGGTVRAAVDAPLRLGAVPDHATAAAVAGRREPVDGALEAVEREPLAAVRHDLEGTVVLVAAHVTAHRTLLPSPGPPRGRALPPPPTTCAARRGARPRDPRPLPGRAGAARRARPPRRPGRPPRRE